MCDHKCKHVGARCVQCLICFLFDFVHGCFIKTTSYLWGAFQLQCCSFCFLVFCCPASVSFTRPALPRVGTSSISCLGGTAEWWVTGCCTQLIGQGSSGSLFHSCMSNSLSIQNVAKKIYIYIYSIFLFSCVIQCSYVNVGDGYFGVFSLSLVSSKLDLWQVSQSHPGLGMLLAPGHCRWIVNLGSIYSRAVSSAVCFVDFAAVWHLQIAPARFKTFFSVIGKHHCLFHVLLK